MSRIQAKIFYFLVTLSFLSQTFSTLGNLFLTILNKTQGQIYSGISSVPRSEFPAGMHFLIPMKFLSRHRRLTISHGRLKINPCRLPMIHP